MNQVTFPREKINIVLTEGIADSAVELLKQAGYTSITHLSHAPKPDELADLLGEAHILGIRSRTEVTKEILGQAPKLLALGCFCIGTNQVDLAACAEKGIPVFNAPFSNTRSVAELTIAAAINLMRCVPAKNQAAHAGVWKKSASGSHEVRTKKIGIVGYGNIGSQLSVLASGLGMHVYYYDVETKLQHGNARSVSSLEELYEISDIITYHVPETPHTKLMVNQDAIAKMKDGVYIINYARGSLVDVDALCEALKTGKVAGAAIDVFPKEPASNEDEFVSPLRDFPNVLLTPHIGGSTQEAQKNIGNEVANKFVSYSDTGTTTGAVNFPEVSLPLKEGAHRITNIHRNVPGVLSNINQIFSEHGANIVGQALQTNDQIGYVIIDIENGADLDHYKKELQAVEGSIRTRLIN